MLMMLWSHGVFALYPAIDSANYQMIQSGMSLEEAEKLLTVEATEEMSAEGYGMLIREIYSKHYPADQVDAIVKDAVEKTKKNLEEQRLGNFGGVTKNVNNLSDGRKVVTFKSSGKSKDTTINLFVDSSGKIVAKDIEIENDLSDDSFSRSETAFQDSEVLDEDAFKKTFPEYEVKQTEGASGYTSMTSFYTTMTPTSQKGNQLAIRLKTKSSGPVGGEVAAGDNAEETFIKAVSDEADALGNGESPISPIT
ncbi:MAG: hypothetical protein JJ956_08025 [Pseudomonadales bacterium]|nr:hypothetical protein [Pseudomonadales bacterium]